MNQLLVMDPLKSKPALVDRWRIACNNLGIALFTFNCSCTLSVMTFTGPHRDSFLVS